jgi:hypothetical protein
VSEKWIKFADLASRLGLPCRAAERYLVGEGPCPNLSKDLHIRGDRTFCHCIEIREDDAETLLKRVLEHEHDMHTLPFREYEKKYGQ